MDKKSKDLSVGVERSIDDLGRLVLPKEMRDKLNFNKNQKVNIKLFKNHIRVEKSITMCNFCDSEKDINYYKNLAVCKNCLEDIISKFSK